MYGRLVCAGRVYRVGYGTGWVYQVGIPGGSQGGYTGYPAMLLGEGPTQRSGPRKALQGPGVGGVGAGRYWDGGGTVPHPCGARSAPCGYLPGNLSECRLLANKARIKVFF